MNAITGEKEIFVKSHSPNGLLVEFSICLKNIPGALAEVSSLLAKMGVNILSGFMNFKPGEEKGRWAFVADLKDLNVSAEDILKRLKELSSVSDADFIQAKYNSLIIDEMHFPLLVMGSNSLLFKVDSWADMASHLLQCFGTGGAVILYEMGLKAGEAHAKDVIKEGFSGKVAFDVILSERIALGWGIPKVINFDEKNVEGLISVQGLFECIPFKEKCKDGKSHFFRGYLVGVLKQLFGKKVKVEEVECVAKGEQNCLFKLG
ncbi:MAG: V4R domain-containing protein [Nitrososphaerales archaeon]